MIHLLPTIFICTKNRNDSLNCLLEDLLNQESVETFPPIYLIDNSSSASSGELIRKFKAKFQNGIYMVHEPRQGVAFARNRALSIALEKNWDVIFLDDDERVSSNWLCNILNSHNNHPEAMIVGPVRPEVSTEWSSWCPGKKCWRRPELGDSEFISQPVGTGNIYIPITAIKQTGFFKEKFTSGGEDTDFTKRWINKNGKILFSRAALAWEPVTKARSEATFVASRIRKSTMIWSDIHIEFGGSTIYLYFKLVRDLLEGVFLFLVNNHGGSRRKHFKIYFGKYLGMKDFFSQRLPLRQE